MLFFPVGWLHVFLSPYTKVEESFNLHATHDFLFYGLQPSALANYDHFIFPGVVPRSFIGSIVLSAVAAVVTFVVRTIDLVRSKFDVQIIVRLTLATINAFGLEQLRRAVTRRFGVKTSMMFMLLTCTQFHIPFWMGRTLPNMFALYPVTVAFAHLVAPARRSSGTALALLTFATVTLRAELVLFLCPIALQALYLRHTTFWKVLQIGLASGVLSLVLTVGVDSYFWNRWLLWPELAGLIFNVYEGKSAEWGTSPPYSYFVNHLPKLLLSSLPLSILGLTADSRTRMLLLPCAVFVGLLSCLGHKEWRFIVYVVPVWNIVAARGAAMLLSAKIRTRNIAIAHAPKLILLGLLIANVMATVLLTEASMMNYPGGEALARLNGMLAHSGAPAVAVHIDNYAAQTGASLFLHEHMHVAYHKTENLVAPEDFWGFDWVITEHADVFNASWRVESSVEGLRGVEMRPLPWLHRLRVPRIIQEPKLWIMRHVELKS